MDIDAQIRALEEQVARESEEIARAQQQQQQQPNHQQQQGVAAAFGGGSPGYTQPPSAAPSNVQHHTSDASAGSDAAKAAPRFDKDSDDRSVFIQGIPNHTDITPEMVAEGFADCGQILKCTLLRDRATGALKGGAYIEFATYEGVGKAIDTKQNITFRGANLTVAKKRSLFNPTRARGRGAGDRGGFRGRGGASGGGFAQQQEMMASMMGMMMGAMASMAGGRGGNPRGGRGGAPGGRGAWRGGGGGGDAVQNADGGRGGRGGFKPF